MERGIVKWFNNSKGYGFLQAAEGSKDVFVHFSSISMDGYRTLRTGQPVLFEAVDSPKGLHATAIQILDEGHAGISNPALVSSRQADKNT